MVNKLFEEEVRKVVKDGSYLKLKTSSAYQSALAEFDGHVKPGFRGQDDPNKFVNFPMAGLRTNKAAGLVSNYDAFWVCLPHFACLTDVFTFVLICEFRETMARIFDPIVLEIENLVSDQVTRVKSEKVKTEKAEVIKVRGQLRYSSNLNI